MAASNGHGVASPAVVASNASETGMQPAKKPRRCFSAHDYPCLLREVAAAKPFGDDIKWVHVLAAVHRAVGRELTLRGIKDRVDILLGYWKLQHSKNLKKSGTEEQYSEKEEILQDLWDFCESVKYEPRIAPRGAACAARRRRFGSGAPGKHGRAAGGDALRRRHRRRRARPGAEPGQENEQQEQRASPEPTQQQRPPSTELQRRQPASVQHALHGTSKGIRGLQSLGLQLLAQREKNELDLRSRELEIEKMKVRHEERRLALDERRLALDEEKHRFEVERWRGERESLLDEIKKNA
ncbi:hypothetical protein HPB51_028118 [Rhipicephalus microplus]|uniref:Uncharacterized protein n=1 Tax=Rhipicephalus microplus TaxID=6941 RepID=A0A9J6CYN9_RHIMP|nr:hypothetical protein HPB51_028118 [Rhipicephalus microplus]